VATKKVTDLSAISAIDTDADVLAIVDVGADDSLKVTPKSLLELTLADLLELGATPEAGDTFLVIDGGVAKYVAYSDLGIGVGGGRVEMSLPVAAAHLPDDTSGSAAAQMQTKVTSDATDPQARWVEALFDDTTEEHIYWSFIWPDNYGSSPVLDVYYKAASATSGTAAFNARIMAVSDGDAQDVDADNFAAEQTVATATVPGTAGYMDVVSITLSNADSVAAGDWVTLALFRDVGDDSVTGDLEVLAANLKWTVA